MNRNEQKIEKENISLIKWNQIETLLHKKEYLSSHNVASPITATYQRICFYRHGKQIGSKNMLYTTSESIVMLYKFVFYVRCF